MATDRLKRGDHVRVVHVYNASSYVNAPSVRCEVILVEGRYVQLWCWPRTWRYHATSPDALADAEVTLRPAHDAQTELSYGYSIRVRRE